MMVQETCKRQGFFERSIIEPAIQFRDFGLALGNKVPFFRLIPHGFILLPLFFNTYEAAGQGWTFGIRYHQRGENLSPSPSFIQPRSWLQLGTECWWISWSWIQTRKKWLVVGRSQDFGGRENKDVIDGVQSPLITQICRLGVLLDHLLHLDSQVAEKCLSPIPFAKKAETFFGECSNMPSYGSGLPGPAMAPNCFPGTIQRTDIDLKGPKQSGPYITKGPPFCLCWSQFLRSSTTTSCTCQLCTKFTW